MPVYVYAIVNAVLALAIAGVIIGLQVWSIATQDRDPGCGQIRLRRRRLRISVSLIPLSSQEPELSPQEIVLG